MSASNSASNEERTHRRKLDALNAKLRDEGLNAEEWREVAEHLRAIDRPEKAARAERRAAQAEDASPEPVAFDPAPVAEAATAVKPEFKRPESALEALPKPSPEDDLDALVGSLFDAEPEPAVTPSVGVREAPDLAASAPPPAFTAPEPFTPAAQPAPLSDGEIATPAAARTRLSELAARQHERPLSADELYEAARAHRLLGQTHEADQAMDAAKRLRALPTANPGYGGYGSSAHAPGSPQETFVNPQRLAATERGRSMGNEVGVSVIIGVLVLGGIVWLLASDLTPLLPGVFVHLALLLMVAIGSRMRGASFSAPLALGFLFTTLVGGIYALVTSASDRVSPETPAGNRVLGAWLIGIGMGIWFLLVVVPIVLILMGGLALGSLLDGMY